jgi:hypothetical protein
MGAVANRKSRVGKPAPSPVSPKLQEAMRRYGRDDVAAVLGVLFAATRERATLSADPLLLLVLDVLEGLRAALIAENRPALGKGATWGRKQRHAGARPAKDVDLARELHDLCDGPAEELAFRVLRSGRVSPLPVMTAAMQGWIDHARDQGKDPQRIVKDALRAAGISENEANNWVASAFRK